MAFMKIAAALTLVSALAGHACAQSAPPFQQIILYKSDQTPLEGNPHTDWEAWSNAYTAGTVPLRFDLMKAANQSAKQVIAQIVFRATDSMADTGVALGVCGPLTAAPSIDGGNCTELGEFAANKDGSADYTPSMSTPWDATPRVYTGSGPRPYWADATATFNSLITNGQPKFANILTFGDGSNGPLVYAVELFVTWN